MAHAAGIQLNSLKEVKFTKIICELPRDCQVTLHQFPGQWSSFMFACIVGRAKSEACTLRFVDIRPDHLTLGPVV